MKNKLLLFLLIAAAACTAFAQNTKKKVKPVPNTTVATHITMNKNKGDFKRGEEVIFTIKMTENKKPVKGLFFKYNLVQNGKTVKSEIISGDTPFTLKTTMNVPGLLFLEALAMDKNKKLLPRAHSFHNRNKNAGVGVLFDMENIKASAPVPADFDTFWKKAKAEVDKIPMKPVLKELPLQGMEKRMGMKLYDVQIPCVNNVPVSAYLFMPGNAPAKSLPAIVSFHGAGVASAKKLTTYGYNALVFDVNAHGIENGKTAAYYWKQWYTTYGNYQYRNSHDKDKYYYKAMYQRVIRALQYIKTHPEWDGKNLIVTGISQGAAQALVAAALDKDVTLCVTAVTAMADHHAADVGRIPGWPRLIKGNAAQKKKIAATAAYYDGNSFASRIQCETYLVAGGVDTTTSPTGVVTVYNSLPAKTKKHFRIYPYSGHDALPWEGNAKIRAIVKAAKK